MSQPPATHVWERPRAATSSVGWCVPRALPPLPYVDIAIAPPTPTGAMGTVLRGVLCAGLSLAMPGVAGILFGLIVLWPWCRRLEVDDVATGLSVALSLLGYETAMALFFRAMGGMVYAGGVGAAIMFAPVLVTGPTRGRCGALAGCAAGLALTLPFLSPLGWLMIGVWQIGVAIAMTVAFLD